MYKHIVQLSCWNTLCSLLYWDAVGTSHYDVNAVFVYFCWCERWGWSQQERTMYYSHVSDSVVVRRCGATLKVRGPAMLFLPVLSALTSCAGRLPKYPSAGVGDLSPGLEEGEGDRSVCSSRGLVSWWHSEDIEGFHFKIFCVVFLHFLEI